MALTVRELLNTGTARIKAGKDGSSAWLDATLLWALACGISRERVLASLGDHLPEPADQYAASFLALCERRANGYPIAYLAGRKEFYGRDFLVDESVLIPRPETEILVEWALETLAACPAGQAIDILDCCTGSGCIPVTLGLELERRAIPAWLAACDLSPDALAMAQRNREALWPRGSIQWFQGDLLEAAPADSGPFDLITANPPYVPRAEALFTEERGWREPIFALDGGPDGLDLIRRLVPQARRRLKPGGWLIMEFGDGQSEAIAAILGTYDYRSTEIRCDLAGLPRMVRSRSRE
jgi:release factor glutamine methyltransferase